MVFTLNVLDRLQVVQLVPYMLQLSSTSLLICIPEALLTNRGEAKERSSPLEPCTQSFRRATTALLIRYVLLPVATHAAKPL